MASRSCRANAWKRRSRVLRFSCSDMRSLLSKALCKRIDPFAKRAFQHASLKEACQHAPASPGDLSAFQLFVSGRAPGFLPGSIISRIAVVRELARLHWYYFWRVAPAAPREGASLRVRTRPLSG